MQKTIKKLGILGDGQLGRMSAMAAKTLGIETVIYGQNKNSPAGQIADDFIEGAYEDQKQLSAFCDKIDVCSYEFENIPVDTVRFIAEKIDVWPDSKLLEICQHRVSEKQFLNDAGIDTAKFQAIPRINDIPELNLNTRGSDMILKTCRFGYDGKGQIFVARDDDLMEKAKSLNSDDLILEECVDFDCEISVIVARDIRGDIVTYDPPLNVHRNHILHSSTVPALLDQAILDKAQKIGRKLAEKVGLVGVLGLELFVTKDGRVLANEIAPRTHNSGHWTMDACKVSQFENHVRAVCGMDVLDPHRQSDVTMINLIGDDVHDLAQYENDPNTHIHLYGKAEARAGRKMGHVNIIKG